MLCIVSLTMLLLSALLSCPSANPNQNGLTISQNTIESTNVSTNEPTNEPTNTPTVVEGCPWVLFPVGKCTSPANNIELTSSITLGDCHNICIMSKNPDCVYIEYTPNAQFSFFGTCTLKGGVFQEADLSTCSNPNTFTNVFSCPSNEPSVSPVASQNLPTFTPTAEPTASTTIKPTTISTDLSQNTPTITLTAEPIAFISIKPTTISTVPSQNTSTVTLTAEPTASMSIKPTTISTDSSQNTPTITPTVEIVILTKASTFQPLITSPVEPTVKPTKKPYLAPTSGPICINWAASDLYGDGFQSAHFFLYDNKDYYRKGSPTCQNNPITYQYCFDPYTATPGDTVIGTITGLWPQFRWEGIFQAYIVDTGATYTGSYGSILAFTYAAKRNVHGQLVPAVEVSVTSLNLISNSVDCKECSSGDDLLVNPNEYDEPLEHDEDGSDVCGRADRDAVLGKGRSRRKGNVQNKGIRKGKSKTRGPVGQGNDIVYRNGNRKKIIRNRNGFDNKNSADVMDNEKGAEEYRKGRRYGKGKRRRRRYGAGESGTSPNDVSLKLSSEGSSSRSGLNGDLVKRSDERQHSDRDFNVVHSLESDSTGYVEESELISLKSENENGDGSGTSNEDDGHMTKSYSETYSQNIHDEKSWKSYVNPRPAVQSSRRMDSELYYYYYYSETTKSSVDSGVEEEMKYGGAYELDTYKLMGNNEHTWCSGNRLGSNFLVSDKAGYNLLYAATVSWADESEDPCALDDLVPGKTYTARVTGSVNPHAKDVSYEFCGIQGAASSEVLFQVNCEGECVPIKYKQACDDDDGDGDGDSDEDNDDDENEMEQAAVTLEGSLYLEGIEVPELSAKDLDVIRASLSHEFKEVAKDDESELSQTVRIVSTKTLPLAKRHDRKLDGESAAQAVNALAHQVDFSVTMASDQYGFDGSDDRSVSMFAVRLSKFLDHSMHSRLFHSKLMAHAVSKGSSSLQAVKHVRLLNGMHVVHKTIVSSMFTDVVVIAGVFAGFLLGSLVVIFMVARWHPNKREAFGSSVAVESALETLPTTLRRTSLHDRMSVVPADSITI